MYFVGLLLGKALFDRIPVGVSLNASILNALLGLQINYDNWFEDFKLIDKDVYNSLKFFRDNDLSQHTYLDQYFVTTNNLGVDCDLKPNGSNILVTNENKGEFIRLKCAYIESGQVKAQLA